MSAQQQPQPNQVIAGRYRLERVLAQGGMGSVWVARHLQLDVNVAIKFMMPEAAAVASARDRFEREAKASALLKSSHIVQMIDYGVEEDVRYIVMDLLVGEDLGQRLNRVRRLPLPVVAKILGQACKGLAIAHHAGIVHRDLKPANLFLAREGDDEVVKVLDFGIAKAPAMTGAGGPTKSHTLMGSPNYMSPEQVLSSKAVDTRTDSWALGVIAFRCLTGRELFLGEELGQILMAVCSAPIPPPTSLVPELGPDVDRFFAVALARDVGQRFQRVQDLAGALQELADRSIVRSVSSSPGFSVSTGASGAASFVPPSQGGVPAVTNQPPIDRPPSHPGQATGLTGSVSQVVPGKPAGGRRSGVVLGVALSGIAALGIAGVLAARVVGRGHPPFPAPAVVTTSLDGIGLHLNPPEVPSGKPEQAVELSSDVAIAAASVVPSASALPAAVASGSARLNTAPPAPPLSAHVASPTRPAGTLFRPPPTAPNCNPNYVLNAKGVKVFKPECFK